MQPSQPKIEFAPEAVNLPSTQLSQEVVVVPLIVTTFLKVPGLHEEHLEEPALLNPVSHEVQTSVDPVL